MHLIEKTHPMKHLFSLSTALLISISIFSGSIDISSKITDVTVFLTGAQVNRKAKAQIQKGKTELLFSDVTPLLVKESIQVKGKGNFTILSVNHLIEEIYSEVATDQIESLKSSFEAINSSIEDLEVKIDVYNKEITLIENTIHTNKNAETVQISNIKETQDYYHTTLLNLKLEKLKFEREQMKKFEKRNEIQRKLNALKVKKANTKSSIKVIVEASNVMEANFEISYFVANAKWFPEYDVRVKNIENPLVLNYKANISQQTGEDWKDVNLTISTSNPNKSNRRPELKKWIVDLNGSHIQNKTFTDNYLVYSGKQFGKVSGLVTDEYGEPLPFVNISVQGSSTGTTTDFDGKFQLTLPKDAKYLEFRSVGYNSVIKNITENEMRVVMIEAQQLLEAIEVVQYKKPLIDKEAGASGATITREDINRMPSRNAESTSIATYTDGVQVRGARTNGNSYYLTEAEKEVNMVDISYKVDEKYTINSNSDYQVVPVQKLEIPSDYQYYCAPKLDKDVFLTAQVVNWEKYNLLEGQASIYFEGTFMGTTIMDVKYITDTLNISIGRDKNIFVQRDKISELSGKKVFGSMILKERNWKTQVKNNKNIPINILVEDQFPISADRQVIVKHNETNSPKIDENTGIVSWKFEKVEPSEKKEIEFGFSVKYPTFVYMTLE